MSYTEAFVLHRHQGRQAEAGMTGLYYNPVQQAVHDQTGAVASGEGWCVAEPCLAAARLLGRAAHLVLAASRRASRPLPSGATVVDRNRCPACCAVPRSSSLHRLGRDYRVKQKFGLGKHWATLHALKRLLLILAGLQLCSRSSLGSYSAQAVRLLFLTLRARLPAAELWMK